MAFGFPLYIDLNGNNCVVLGGGDYAADKVDTLLQFGAKVTVISPALCGRLQELDKTRAIRYISLAVSGSAPQALQSRLRDLLESRLPELLQALEDAPEAGSVESAHSNEEAL